MIFNKLAIPSVTGSQVPETPLLCAYIMFSDGQTFYMGGRDYLKIRTRIPSMFYKYMFTLLCSEK